MPEPLVVIAALVPGALTTGAMLALAAPRVAGSPAAEVVESVRAHLPSERIAAARRRLVLQLARAGWREQPERVVVLTVVLSAGLAALGLSTVVVVDNSTAASIAVAGALTGVAVVAYALRAAVNSRRKRLTRELAPLLELFMLELGGGGSALSALGSVTLQLDGELARELRRLLVASQVSGSSSFETRLRAYAERLHLTPLGSLATILTASREYGTGVTQGVRALAADLRRAQRRELIAHSRRALNHVLFPAAIGVLLPFLAILLFPAVSSLERNLR
jgi:pilus assembly protein TadC